MFRSVLEERAYEVERKALTLAGAIDPDGIPASEAVRLYERLDRAGRAVAAAKVLLARRVEDSREWKRLGYRSAAEHLAATSGASLGAARSELETSNALPGLASTKDALVNGTLSATQAAVVAGAAKVNPEAEAALIGRAATANLQELREEAGRAKAAADPDPLATRDRIHRERRAGTHTDREGAFNLHARGTVDEGASIAAELQRLTDEIFRQRGKAGTVECRDAYQFDALVEMARRSSGTSSAAAAGPGAARQPRPQHLALLRLDVAALWRGHVQGDELCEITGVGPIPVPVARRLLGDAVLKLILTRGVAVANVTSLTRVPTQAMRYALLWTSPTCSVEGCSRTIVEYDHVHGAEYATTSHTRLAELEPKCPGHHDLHTLHGWERIRGPGKQPMVPPDHPLHPANADPPGDTPCANRHPDDRHASRVSAAGRSRQPDLFGPPA